MTPKEFVDKLLLPAKAIEVQYKIPYVFTIAQAALESGWGRHSIGNNLFGIKADKNWTGLKKLVTTTEYHNNDNYKYPEIISITKQGNVYLYRVKDWFRDYATLEECLIDHAKFLIENKRYKKAFEFTDPIDFAREVAKAGYATSPIYFETMKNMIASVNNRLK